MAVSKGLFFLTNSRKFLIDSLLSAKANAYQYLEPLSIKISLTKIFSLFGRIISSNHKEICGCIFY